MKIGFVSDLHLEFQTAHNFESEQGGDVLILAGDITSAFALRPDRTDKDGVVRRRNFGKLRDQLTSKYTVVLYVMGNHEHYRFTFQDTAAALKQYLGELGFDNVFLLNRDAVVHQGVQFVGATLWTDFFKENPVVMQQCEFGMNDYRIIADRNAGGPMNARFTWNQHHLDRNYIFNKALNYSGNSVVITHHGPTLKSLNPIHTGNGLDGAFCSDLSENILANPKISHWIHGHTHHAVDYSAGSCMIKANQRGYEHADQSYTNFTGIQHFEI